MFSFLSHFSFRVYRNMPLLCYRLSISFGPCFLSLNGFLSTSKTPSQQLHLDQNRSEALSASSHSPKNFLLGLFEMLWPELMAAIPLIPSPAPHLSQGLASAQSGEGSAYRFRAEFRHTPSTSHCYRRMLFSGDTRPQRQSESHGRYLQSTLISPIGSGTERKGGANSCHSSIHRQCRTNYTS